MRKLKKCLCISIILGVIVFTSVGISFATTETELNSQKNNIDEQIAETNSEITGVKSQMTNALTQINRLNSQISSYETEISSLEEQLSTLNTQIKEKEENIQEQEKKYVAQKGLLENRLIALYESGTTSYLDMLLSSEGLSDFISKYYLISQLAELDQDLLKKIEDTQNQIQVEKQQLETSKQTVTNSKAAIQQKRSSLDLSMKDKNNLVSTLTAEEKELNEKLEELEEDRRVIQNELAIIAKKEKSNNSSGAEMINLAPSSCGYIFPIPGLSKSNINNRNYPSYPGHNGTDINIGVVGKSVVAVKAGTVEKSKAFRNPDGSYRSYGEYVTINHHDGTQTVYAHLLAGSRQVSPGQEVTQGQVIGTVGSTGNSTGPHLHFGVFINSKGGFVNPLPYLP